MSPLWKFCFLYCDSFLSWSSWRNSFLQRDQNSFLACWIRLHLFWQHKSVFENSPGGGMTTLDFIVRIFAGESGNSPLWEVLNLIFLLSQPLVSIRTLLQRLYHEFVTVKVKSFERAYLSFPGNTHVSCNKWVLFALDPISTKLLHEYIYNLIMHFFKSPFQFILYSDEIASIVWIIARRGNIRTIYSLFLQ